MPDLMQSAFDDFWKVKKPVLKSRVVENITVRQPKMRRWNPNFRVKRRRMPVRVVYVNTNQDYGTSKVEARDFPERVELARLKQRIALIKARNKLARLSNNEVAMNKAAISKGAMVLGKGTVLAGKAIVGEKNIERIKTGVSVGVKNTGELIKREGLVTLTARGIKGGVGGLRALKRKVLPTSIYSGKVLKGERIVYEEKK